MEWLLLFTICCCCLLMYPGIPYPYNGTVAIATKDNNLGSDSADFLRGARTASKDLKLRLEIVDPDSVERYVEDSPRPRAIVWVNTPDKAAIDLVKKRYKVVVISLRGTALPNPFSAGYVAVLSGLVGFPKEIVQVER
jgi:hypothetical protein